jgi:Acetyltransferase (GNAT) family
MTGAGGPSSLPPHLQARLDELWFENYAAWARGHPRGTVEEVDGWRIARLGSDWPFYNVATPRAGAGAGLAALLATLPRFGYRVWLRDGMEDVEEQLLRGGFTTELVLPAYIRELSVAAPAGYGETSPVPGGYEVSRAESREDIEESIWGDRLSAWLDIADIKGAFPDPWRMAQEGARRLYQARHEGRLVGTGQSLMRDGVAGVYTMWTAEPHRALGLAAAILRRICDDLAAAGASHVTLQSVWPGGGLYARAGFEPCYEYRVYGEQNPG